MGQATTMAREEAREPERRVVTRQEWLEARKALLAKEKALTHARDALSEERRALPMVEVEKKYVFEEASGKRSLADLFDGKKQLLVYHFMFDPSWDAGCKSCSFVADNLEGSVVHLRAQDIALVAVSRAPSAKIDAYKKRMGWTFRWLSSYESDFNYDFGVSFTREEFEAGSVGYNYVKQPFPVSEAHGLSVFLREGGRVYHTYSTYARGVDGFINTYNLVDLTPLGRREASPMDWLRRHDEYERA